MRVKIGDTWYTPKDGPICLELDPKDKQNIANMSPEATKWAIYSDEHSAKHTSQEILDWMDK